MADGPLGESRVVTETHDKRLETRLDLWIGRGPLINVELCDMTSGAPTDDSLLFSRIEHQVDRVWRRGAGGVQQTVPDRNAYKF